MAVKENNILNSVFVNFDLYVKPQSNFSELNLEVNANFSGVILITNINKSSENFPDEYIQLMTKICQAVDLEMGNNALHINIMPTNPIQFIELKKNLDIKRLIVFGPTPEEMGIHFSIQPYKIVKWSGKEFLFVDSIKKIHDDISKKQQLWALLKQLFLT